MGGATLLFWISLSLSSHSGGEVGRTVVASKSQSSALISSQSFQGTYLEAVVPATSVENCNNIAFPSRFQLARSGLKKFSQTISSFGHDIVDLSILQSPFASARDPLFSMLETLEASANSEQIEKPQRTSQGQQSIQTDDSETKFEKWSTGRDRRCRERGAVSKQTTLGQHITTSEDGCSWSCRTAAVKHHGGNYHCSGGCRQGCCSCRTVRSRSAYSSQGPQEGVGITAGFSRRAVAISRSQGRQNGDAWSDQQAGQAAEAAGKSGHQDFRNGPQLEGVHGQGDAKVCHSPADVPTMSPTACCRLSPEKSRNPSSQRASAKCISGYVPSPCHRTSSAGGSRRRRCSSELVQEKPRPPIGPFRKRLTPVSPTKVHTTHLKK